MPSTSAWRRRAGHQAFLELGSASLLCQMVEHGMGLSFLPEYIVRPALSAGRIARLYVPDCTVPIGNRQSVLYDKTNGSRPR